MNPRYAAVFGIESLELNKHFQPITQYSDNELATDKTRPDTLSLTSQLLADIQRAIAPAVINRVVKSTEIQLLDNELGLITPQLSSADKRALWALISKHLDEL